MQNESRRTRSSAQPQARQQAAGESAERLFARCASMREQRAAMRPRYVRQTRHIYDVYVVRRPTTTENAGRTKDDSACSGVLSSTTHQRSFQAVLSLKEPSINHCCSMNGCHILTDAMSC